jgi:protein O-GlcNAc transferase
MAEAHPLQIAYQHHLADRFDEAEAIYRDVLKTDPNNGIALYLLGVLLHDSKRLAEALPLLEKAAKLYPVPAESNNRLSAALREAGRIDESIAAARIAVEADPKMVEAHCNLGVGRHLKGDLAAAAAAYGKAIELNPNFGPAYNNMGNLLQASRELEAAETAYRRAAELQPTVAEPFNNLGSVLQYLNRPDEAIAACRKALELSPRFAPAHNNLATALKDRGDITPALESFREAIRCQPGYVKAHSNLLYSMHFDPAQDGASLLAAHEAWAATEANPLTHDARPHKPPPASEVDRKLRLGYVSADLREHPVGRFMLTILSHRDKNAFEVTCYSDAQAVDPVTDALRRRSDRWLESAALSDEQLAARIRDDKIDVLIDLALHSGRNRLLTFARRPAPVQATYLGYPGTSGMEAMDFRLTDTFLDLPHREGRFYSERSIHLPRTYWCYAPPPNCPESGPLPALAAGNVTFGCLNNFAKVSEPALHEWAKILQRVPSARLILHAPAGEAHARMLRLMQSHEIDPARIELLTRQTAIEYLASFNRIDIGLDPFPYEGGTSTCEALWMGTPVISLMGEIAVRRAGVSLLGNAGLSELVARNSIEYVQLAVALGEDVPRLTRLRAEMRERMMASPLMNAKPFVRDLESAYQAMWRSWVGDA